jgi:hypothetical protein
MAFAPYGSSPGHGANLKRPITAEAIAARGALIRHENRRLRDCGLRFEELNS